MVRTRASENRERTPRQELNKASVPGTEHTPEQIRQLQEEDQTLIKYRRIAQAGKQQVGKVKFLLKNGLLYREYTPTNKDPKVLQLVVPTKLRVTVLRIAHDSLMAGHMGTRKTSDRVVQAFYWPGINSDIRKYCQS